ncbi:MAG: SNF2-related protein, partial [Syntrophothermus sp.]
ISRNLVNSEFENYTYYPAEFPGLNEIKSDYEMPFLSRETIQRFPKVKIEQKDPGRIPSLFPMPQYSTADEGSDGEELYDYQNKGVKLLVKNPFAILSDEDGMGKTLQAVNALRYLIKRKQIRSALVICSETEIGKKRTTVAGGRPEGWIGNLGTWAPELNSLVLSSDKNKRMAEWNSPAQIYIISYENLLADEADEVIGSSRLNQFDCIIMDSYLSNRFTAYQRDRIFNKLKLRYLWIMDNSPIENYESDIVAYFINTVASAPFHQFSGSEGIGEFSRRGLLKDMGAELPMRIFRNKWFELTDDQRKDYTAILEQGLTKLRNSVENGNLLVIRPQIFTILHEILQALNFPASGEMSKKALMLVNEAKRITEHGQKGVILSQYEKYGLRKIEEILTKYDIKFVTYRTGMNSTAMERACQEFRERSDIHIFLGDVKAINKRLNLGSFNQIIHFDQWWNPVSQWAAEDRISSYNQEHVMVQYYRTANSVEEKIYEKLSAKGLLNKLIIENLTQTVVADMISTEEWFELLDLETEGLLNSQSTISYYESALNSVRGNSFDTVKKLIINFLVKSGFYKISGTGPIADDESTLIMASKMINDKEENVLIKILDTPSAGEDAVKTFLAQMSEQNNISLGIIMNRGEFAPVCGKYSAVKINLLTLIDISLLTQYLMHFKLI